MSVWEKFTRRMKDIDALGGAAALLEWDQATGMPPAAQDARGEQVAVVGRIRHELATSPEVGEWLAALEAQPDLDETQRAAVHLASRRFRRASALPSRWVEEMARARNDGFGAWLKAKEASDFSLFEGALQHLVDLSREQAELLLPVTEGPGVAHPYDALLADYDPGSTVAELRPMFTRLSGELNTLLGALDGLAPPAEVRRSFEKDGLRRLSERVMKDFGFRMDAGRLDLSEHPFSTGIGPGDTRITTHLLPDNLLASIGAVTHECGHGMYEQGLPHHLAGTGLNEAAGFGMHESQSRFWENFIGRSLPFFRYLVPRMAGIWPDLDLTPEALYGAANRVERSLIRIFADEATYNLHIVARFELELGIFEGRIQARDLPDAWDEAYRRNVGVVAPTRRDGVLQDVHWSQALFAYFPSYTLGNLYAASLGATLEAEEPGLWTLVERGDFAPVLRWLRARVHQKGHLADAPVIFRAAVGDRDPVEDLVAHLWARQGALYGVSRPA